MKDIPKEVLYDNIKYLNLLSNTFTNITSAVREVVNLKAILNLPKATEHFLTDIHGEAEAFNHVMQNASGTVRRKVYEELGSTVSIEDLEELTSLIYYPQQKLDLIKSEKKDQLILENWYKLTIYRLIKVARASASKYTRSKVRKMLPSDFAYIMEELLQEDEHRFNKKEYYNEIIASIVEYERADLFIIQISQVIKRLVVDHLHIIGDIFDRGPAPDKVMDNLMEQRDVDIQWGNHDVLWMGAAAGNPACVANVVRISLRYANDDTLENAYGISLLPLITFASKVYANDECKDFMPKESRGEAFDVNKKLFAKMHKAISIIQFKVEDQIISQHPEYNMENRRVLRDIDLAGKTVKIEGKAYTLNDVHFPTIDKDNPAQLTKDEQYVIDTLCKNFTNSDKLRKHIRFLYAKGSMYTIFNENLLFHACILLNEDGTLKKKKINGEYFSGKSLMDKYDQLARQAYFDRRNNPKATDFLWFLWCNEDSTLFGKDKMTTFERYFIDDKESHEEKYSPYYTLMKVDDGTIAKSILEDFGLKGADSHIVNGHTPVRVSKGENPIRAGGKLLIIDGGFSKAYQKNTGIAGFTLTYNSYGLTLISHKPFESVEKVLKEGFDIKSTKQVVEQLTSRKRVKDTDIGKTLQSKIYDLEMLINAYKKGILKPKD